MSGKPADEVRQHFQRLVGLGCMVSGAPPQIHHCKGGSMLEVSGLHGVARKTNDWLTIPLAERYHEGEYGIERGVKSWEAAFGTQVGFLIQVCDRLGYDVFKLAGVTTPLEELRARYATPSHRRRTG